MDKPSNKPSQSRSLMGNSIFVDSWNKCWINFAFYAGLLCLLLVVVSIPHIIKSTTKTQKPLIKQKEIKFRTDMKYILVWKTLLEDKRFLYGQDMFIQQRCKYINCYLTDNKSLLGDDERNFDAIVFNVRDIKKFPYQIYLFKSLERRLPYQKYIFRSLDPAETYPACNPIFDGFFNWTWTYRLDSDIPHPFINIYKFDNELVGPKYSMTWIKRVVLNDTFAERVTDKEYSVAWIVPKCPLKNIHQNFIDSFRKELAVFNLTLDDFGACSKECHLDNCYQLLEEKYYFNLVLEDFETEDYVTERSIKTLNYNVVPIFKGSTNYSRFFPPGSFLDVKQQSLDDLASKIFKTIQEQTTYHYLFGWKNHYYYKENSRHDVCNLCEKLNDMKSVYTHKVYDNFRSWWNPNFKNSCTSWSLLSPTQ